MNNFIANETTPFQNGRLIPFTGKVSPNVARKNLSKKALHHLESEINERKKTEALLRENNEGLKYRFNSSYDVLWDHDLETNEVNISDGYEIHFGHKIELNMTLANNWICHVHPDNRATLEKDLQNTIESKDAKWQHSYRFLRADGSVAKVVSSGIILRNPDGKAYRMIGSMQDLSKQNELEEKLEHEIKIKEQQIAKATDEARETERSDIGKELHDNVNQLLTVSRLYIDMAKQGGDNTQMYLRLSSEYTITAIEEIRKLTKGLTTDFIRTLGLCESIYNIARVTMEINPVKISCELKTFKEDSVNDKFKLNVFRIVQEELNNILKHAKATEVVISLLQNKKSIILSVSDNGVGFDINGKTKGIGVSNIISRTELYKGTLNFISKPGEGCCLVAKFPVGTLKVIKPQLKSSRINIS